MNSLTLAVLAVYILSVLISERKDSIWLFLVCCIELFGISAISNIENDPYGILEITINFFVYSTLIILLKKYPLIALGFFLVIFFELVNFAIRSVYFFIDTYFVYNLILIWYKTYFYILAVSVFLISFGIIKGSKNGGSRANNNFVCSRNARLFSFADSDSEHQSYCERRYPRV